MKIRLQMDDKGNPTGKFIVVSGFDANLIPAGYVRINDEGLYGPANILPCEYRTFEGNPNIGQIEMTCVHPQVDGNVPVTNCIDCPLRLEIIENTIRKDDGIFLNVINQVECRHRRSVKTGCCRVDVCTSTSCPLNGQPVTKNDCIECDHRES